MAKNIQAGLTSMPAQRRPETAPYQYRPLGQGRIDG
jgi:hypothetical protein